MTLQYAVELLYEHYVRRKNPPAVDPINGPRYLTASGVPSPLLVLFPRAPYSEQMEGHDVDMDLPAMRAFRAGADLELPPSLNPARVLLGLQMAHDNSAILAHGQRDDRGQWQLASPEQFRKRFTRHLIQFCCQYGLNPPDREELQRESQCLNPCQFAFPALH